MLKLNPNYDRLQQNYLFLTVRQKTAAFLEANPGTDIIRLGIGDVTRPLAPSVIREMHAAVDDMGSAATFKGYGEDFGYKFLRNAIVEHDYAAFGVSISVDEVFVNDGAKSDTSSFAELFDVANSIAVCDPVYPVYLDASIMAGHQKIIYMPCTADNDFVPELPNEVPDIIYLCYPNNPTGAMATHEQLKTWVDYALKNGSVILYDAAYSAFIGDGFPKTIYEIDGAKHCAVEFKSYSKTAGFTGVRCGYTVVPSELVFGGKPLRAMWSRRQATKFNEASYISQRGASAIYTPDGARETQEIIDYYKNNATLLFNGLTDMGFEVYGGKHSPYVWMRTPNGVSSWDFFDTLLDRAQVVGTPGSGFGASGEGYFRLTAFGTQENSIRALDRIRQCAF